MKKYAIAIVGALIFLLACGIPNVNPENPPQVDPDRFQVVAITEQPNAVNFPVLAVRDTQNNDTIAILANTNEDGSLSQVNSVLFTNADNEYLNISVDAQGLPDRLDYEDGYILFTNYNNNTATMTAYTNSGEMLSSAPITFDSDKFRGMREFFTSNGAVSAAGSSDSPPVQRNFNGYTGIDGHTN